MNVGDLVRKRGTVREGEADELGIVVEVDERSRGYMSSYPFPVEHVAVKVRWFPKGLAGEETWMENTDLEVI